MKFGIVVQSRFDSSRFRGKATSNLANGQKTLEFLLRRLKKGKYPVILATAISKDCDCLEEIANNLNVEVYRGSKKNVLGRFLNCAKIYNLDSIIRITGDCPLIDKNHVEKFVKTWISIKKNTKDKFILTNKFPFSFCDGFDTEIFASEDLEKMNFFEKFISKEHVTTAFYKSKKINKVNILSNDISLFNKVRLVLDYKEDLITINNIISNYQKIYPKDKDCNFLDMSKILKLPLFLDYYKNPSLAPNSEYLIRNRLIYI